MLEENCVQSACTQTEQLIIYRDKVKNYPSFKIKFKSLLKFLGPAFIVSVAYIDPAIFVLGLAKQSYLAFLSLFKAPIS